MKLDYKNFVIEIVCDKCRKSAIPDKTNSNDNWIAFDGKCKCGGNMKLRKVKEPVRN